MRDAAKSRRSLEIWQDSIEAYIENPAMTKKKIQFYSAENKV